MEWFFLLSIGGTVARVHSWPWMVLLIYESTKDGKNYMCGATIISDQWLMTAAHCAMSVFQ
jgi:elastase-1